MKWIFCPIDGSVNKENFDCGIHELDDYLKKYAKQNDKKGVAKTFVAIPEEGEKIVAGYYSVSMDKIEFEVIPENYKKGLPRYPLPAMLIGKLAVDKSMQGTGLGNKLLIECFYRAVNLSSEIGIFAVTVAAINEKAKEFYLKYGFIPLVDNEFTLFIPIKTILTVVR
ncbi:acetyltransferase, GNAT family protein [Calothrix sp. NIES-4071]|nr:acetyltransferase, GNAT family protein [Calothrix sp. NIES-4071]BAZ63713.1 acetyltransferase, GNAT family protein [Calothrix sp. NIES-4105]